MEFVIESFFEIYVELMFLIVPEKNASKKHIFIAKIMAVCVLIALIALTIWGMVLLVDYKNMWGIAPYTSLGVLAIWLSIPIGWFLADVAGGVLYTLLVTPTPGKRRRFGTFSLEKLVFDPNRQC